MLLRIVCVLMVLSLFGFSSSRKHLERELSFINDIDTLISRLDIFQAEKSVYSFIPLGYPVDTTKYCVVSSNFGHRTDPFTKSKRFHAGIDFASPKGTHVYSTSRGNVTYVGIKGGYGKCIIVENRYGFKTIYAHLNDYYTHKGSIVRRGTKIGFVGSTGRSTGNHLHYEIHKNDSILNPKKLLNIHP